MYSENNWSNESTMKEYIEMLLFSLETKSSSTGNIGWIQSLM